MTARAFPFDNEFLSRAATRIINEVHGGMFSPCLLFCFQTCSMLTSIDSVSRALRYLQQASCHDRDGVNGSV